MPSTEIQWFPGHMAKTRRMMKECLPLVDIVIEVLDARIPLSSKNPEIAGMCENKPILTVFNKCSLSNPEINDKWKSYYRRNGLHPLFIDCKTGEGVQRIAPAVKEILSEKIRRNEEKGMAGRRLKAMIVGIPNVGKSTLINVLAGTAKAKAEDRPGVTTDKQWVLSPCGIDLLDMPGVLWPKFEDRSVGLDLAATGAIKDGILDTETISAELCQKLCSLCPDMLCARYKLDRASLENADGHEIYEKIGRKRGFLLRGGELDTERLSAMILDEFRAGKIGRISLELPED